MEKLEKLEKLTFQTTSTVRKQSNCQVDALSTGQCLVTKLNQYLSRTSMLTITFTTPNSP